jgi:hypothetical protein
MDDSLEVEVESSSSSASLACELAIELAFRRVYELDEENVGTVRRIEVVAQ